jgi:hypothetical protein
MMTNYLIITSILAILIIIGFKLRSAGKDIENKNLTHAGNAWLVINGAAVLFFLVMIVTTQLKGSEVCNCSDIYLTITKEEIAAKGDQKKSDAIVKKYEKDIEACQEMLFEKFKGNQSKIQQELNKCSSFKKLNKLMDEANNPQVPQAPELPQAPEAPQAPEGTEGPQAPQ